MGVAMGLSVDGTTEGTKVGDNVCVIAGASVGTAVAGCTEGLWVVVPATGAVVGTCTSGQHVSVTSPV